MVPIQTVKGKGMYLAKKERQRGVGCYRIPSSCEGGCTEGGERMASCYRLDWKCHVTDGEGPSSSWTKPADRIHDGDHAV